jgi:hypothetical protein
MPLHVVITDLLPSCSCELTGKSDVECVRVRFDDTTPEAVIATKELLRLLRFRKSQQNKIDSIPPPVSRKEPGHDQGLPRPQS